MREIHIILDEIIAAADGGGGDAGDAAHIASAFAVDTAVAQLRLRRLL